MGYGDYMREKYSGGSSSTSDTKKRWWEEEQELISGWDDDEYKGRSVSSARQYLGHYAWGERTWGGDDVHAKLNKVSSEIVRLMNTVRNSKKGEKEKSLTISWSQGKQAGQNDPKSDSVVLSPDVVVGADGKANESDNPEVIDGLGGQVLMGSTLKRTMSRKAFINASEDKTASAAHNRALWEAVETAKAKQALLSEWPGFAPYLKRHQALTTAAQEEVQQFIDSKPDKLSAAVAAAAWTISNPGQPLKLPPKIEQAVEKIADELDDTESYGRYLSSMNAVNYLKTIFEDDQQQQQQPPQPQPQGGQGGDGGGQGSDGSGKQDGNQDGNGQGKDKSKNKGGNSNQPQDGQPGGNGAGPSSQPPKITDQSLFGSGVDSSHLGVPNPVSADEDPVSREGVEAPKDLGNRPPVTYYRNAGNPTRYKKLAFEAKHITRAVVSAISFRRTAPEFPLHGLLSGDLDDGSLDKLALREQQPAVFERKEITAIPDVAIGILVDESGSMGGLQEQQARLVCIGLYEAFRKLRGLKLMVLGYTDGNGLCMMDHFSLTSPNPECISNICSMGGTPTNWAMEESIKKLCISYPEAKQRYLFVITDGSPNGGRSAMKHCHDISIWGKQRFGVNTYGIGVAGAPNQQTGEYTFGKGKFVCLPDVATSSRVIATFLARVTAKT